MFIEHRTYTIKPGRVAEYMQEYCDNGWEVHSAHTPCVGHYTTEAGNLFRIISMWRYASFEDRLERRATLNAMKPWQECMGRISPLVMDIRSNLIVPSPCWAGATGDWHIGFYRQFDEMRMEDFLAALTDGVEFAFGNRPAVTGKAAVRASVSSLWSGLAGAKRSFLNVVQNAGHTVVESSAVYTRKNGAVVTIPSVTMLQRESGRVSSMRVYMDASPLGA